MDISMLINQVLEQVLGKRITIHKIDSLGGGCINSAAKVVSDAGVYFAKWNANCPPDLLEREADGLRELSLANSSLVVPKPLVALPLTGSSPALLVTDFLETTDHRPSNQQEELGRGLANLHQFHARKFGFPNTSYCGSTPQANQWEADWPLFFGRNRIGALVALLEKHRALSAEERKLYERLVDKLPEILCHNPQPALVHGDLWSGNFMETDRGPALVDPACSYSDREFDLAIMQMFGGFTASFWAAYQEASPLPHGWQERNELYQLYHYLNHAYLFGGGYGQTARQIARYFVG
jgi:protein-ribulosamine 3-kinase